MGRALGRARSPSAPRSIALIQATASLHGESLTILRPTTLRYSSARGNFFLQCSVRLQIFFSEGGAGAFSVHGSSRQKRNARGHQKVDWFNQSSLHGNMRMRRARAMCRGHWHNLLDFARYITERRVRIGRADNEPNKSNTVLSQ